MQDLTLRTAVIDCTRNGEEMEKVHLRTYRCLPSSHRLSCALSCFSHVPQRTAAAVSSFTSITYTRTHQMSNSLYKMIYLILPCPYLLWLRADVRVYPRM